jgi:hypothetical protein
VSKICTDLPSEVLAVLAKALGFRLSCSRAPDDDEWALSHGHGTTHIQHVGTRAAVCAFLTGYSAMQLHTTRILNELENAHKELILNMRSRLK